MRIAYLGSPGPYGHFSLYRNVRAGLAPHGFQTRWVGHGRWAVDACNDPTWESELAHGEIVGPESTDFDFLGKALVSHVAREKYDAILCNIPQDRAQMNITRYLPQSILRVIVVGMMGGGTYRLCRAIRDNVHATVAISPRLRDDLVKSYGFNPSRISVISAIDLEPFKNLPPRPSEKSLRLIYFGRISEGQKGIFALPQIMQQLQDEDVHLSIVGHGPDLEELQKRCRPLGDRVTFPGAVHPDAVPALLGKHDVFIFPTRYEGVSIALLEALAAGCVPVCSNLRGVTEWVVQNGKTGFLFPVDDIPAATQAIRKLARDRLLLQQFSAAAVEDCRLRFDTLVAGKAYADLLHSLKKNPPPIAPSLPLEKWNYPGGFERGWRGYVPERLKNLARAWFAR
jgi:glycosyltransferase involved in cell wall biosynthesis